MHARRHQGARGFTLPEIMTAVLILTFVFSVFGAAFPACSQAVSRARHIDAATDACQQQLETLRTTAFASLPQPDSGTTSVVRTFAPPASLPAGTGSITYSGLSGSLAGISGRSSRLKVEVSTTWQGRAGDRGTVTVTGILFQ